MDTPWTAYRTRLLDLDTSALVENGSGLRFTDTALGAERVPVLVNDGGSHACYLLSSRAHYIDYVREEIGKMPADTTTRAAGIAVAALGLGCTATHLARAVHANHWLLSTPPRRPVREEDVREMTRDLTERFPTHALTYRRIDASDERTSEAFRACGWSLVVNRPIHWWSPDELPRIAASKRGNVFRDIRALERSGVTVAPAEPGDAADIARLYRMLYIEKHSALNPAFTPAFFELLLRTGAQTLTVLKARGRVGAFLAHSIDDGAVVPTVIGYDTSVAPRSIPWYRHIMATLFQRSLAEKLPLFLSTGAADFKRNRGAVETLELEAVYTGHLPFVRRLPWLAVRAFMRAAVSTLDTRQI
ncbi:MAG: GNAT family N-acetyltransferase [Polyangiaceae bacterium]